MVGELWTRHQFLRKYGKRIFATRRSIGVPCFQTTHNFSMATWFAFYSMVSACMCVYIYMYRVDCHSICIYCIYIASEIGDRFVRDFEHGAPKDNYRFTAPIDCISMSGAQLTNLRLVFLPRLAWHGPTVRYQWSPQNGSCRSCYITIQLLQFTKRVMRAMIC